MSKPLFLSDWIAATGARVNGDLPVDSFDPSRLCTDSRTLASGDSYLPLKGDSFNGHTFLPAILQRGALLAFCEQSWFEQHPELANAPLILVEDSLKAYQSLANAWRRKLALPVIAITGSSGKTSSKEILKQVLAPFYQVHATEQNFNNEIGVPKTLLSLNPHDQVCIVEMGMRGLGQIQELCEIAEPEIGLITNIGPVHLSELGSQANIVRAKWELADYLADHQGCLIINLNNPFLKQEAADYKGQLIACGSAIEADIRLVETWRQDQLQHIKYTDSAGEHQLSLDLLGEHQALNLLCALAVLKKLGATLPPNHSLEIPRLFGRQQKYAFANGPTLINDAYNANPDSMRAALSVLVQEPGRRIAVLGAMAELGADAERFHKELGAFCASLELDWVFVVGEPARSILEGLGQVRSDFFEDHFAAIEALQQVLKGDDSVLFKASRSAGLEKVVQELVAHYQRLSI